MIEFIYALLAGVGLGIFYFTGLWWTVKALSVSQNPALLSLGSFLVRTAAVLTGFYLVMGWQWERLLVCLLGFMTARIVLVRRLKPETARRTGTTARS